MWLTVCCFPIAAPQESMDAASKAMQELQEELAATKQAAADEASKAAEASALELQKMQVERTKLEVRRQPSAVLCVHHVFLGCICLRVGACCNGSHAWLPRVAHNFM